jgi:hypothetical protein
MLENWGKSLKNWIRGFNQISLSSSASSTTEPTNDWLIFVFFIYIGTWCECDIEFSTTYIFLFLISYRYWKTIFWSYEVACIDFEIQILILIICLKWILTKLSNLYLYGGAKMRYT